MNHLSTYLMREAPWWRDDGGFQTAEALGIAAVGVLVAFAMLALLQGYEPRASS